MVSDSKKIIDEYERYVGMRLRDLRREKKISQSELGDIVGCSFQQVQKYERAVNRVSAGKIFHIAEFLGVPVSTFFPGEVRDAEVVLSEEERLVQLFRCASREEQSALLVLFRRFGG